MSVPPRVRFAPSPTGFLHIGGLRMAFNNWLVARRQGGTFLLRVEDTDRERYVEGAIENLCRSLAACGIMPDEGVMLVNGQLTEKGEFGPYLQSKRRDKHLAYANELIQRDKAYYCFCTKERLEQVAAQQKAAKQPAMYDRHCRNISAADAAKRVTDGEAHVIRLKVPTTGVCTMQDVIRGKVEIPWAQVDDQVLIKSDGYPTYHLAAMCDDHDMQITLVIRGEEWLPSLPKHLFIYEAMGWTAPEFAHLPLLLNTDRSKLSKRQGDVAVEEYLKKGYLPEALLNFVVFLGWNPGTDQEIFSVEELIQAYDLSKVNKSGAVFNIEKLDWLNAQYIRKLPEADYLERLHVGKFISDLTQERAAMVVKDRITKLADVPVAMEDVQQCAAYEAALLVWKKSTPEKTAEYLQALADMLKAKPDTWFDDLKKMEHDMFEWIASNHWSKGDVLWPLRVALSGRKTSAGPFEMMYVVGKQTVLKRIRAALAK